MGKKILISFVCLFASLMLNFLPVYPVKAAVTITNSPILTQGQVDTTYSVTLTATGGTAPYTWSLASGTLPPGLSLYAAGLITGIPTTLGTYTFSLTATDSTSATATGSFVIVIDTPPLTIVSTSLSAATEGAAYSAMLTATGGKTPYYWTISSGTLPSGLTLGTTGYITGTPARGTQGSYTFVVTVTDSATSAHTKTQTYYLTVEKGGFSVTVNIGTGLKTGSTRVYSGSTVVSTLTGGASTVLSFDLGATPQIGVDATVAHSSDTGIRYRTDESRITVSESVTNVTFNYYTEYAVDLKTDPASIGQQTGSGWYKEGYVLRNTAQTEIADQSNAGVQYRFANWKLPTGESVSGRDLSYTVTAPGTCIAVYDTYYRLTRISPYGETNVINWYKANSTAEWNIQDTQVSMPGFFGIFGGKYNAVNPAGSTVMDAPKTMTVSWEPDYTLPFILIPLALLVLVFGCYGIYLLANPRSKPAAHYQGGAPPPQWVRPPSPQPPPQPVMPPPWYRPAQPPPPQTTVVMIGGDTTKPKIGPSTTKEQLLEKFGELLEKYGEEVKASGGGAAPVLPKIGIAPGTMKPPPAAELPAPPRAMKGEEEIHDSLCNSKSKRLLRPVATRWKKVATKDTLLESGEKETGSGIGGTLVVWSRDIYQEWEIITCELPRGHKETHERSTIETVYSLLNSITEVKVYKPEDELIPPQPHYTDNMPQIDVESYQIITTDRLPPTTIT